MRKLLFTFLFLVINSLVWAQPGVAKIKFEQAEEYYTNGDYTKALDYITESESLLGMSNTRTLYLKILIQNKLVQAKKGDFNMVQSLKLNCDNYLKATEGSEELEDKYKEVYFISEENKKYAASKQDYEALREKEKMLEKQKELEKQAAEMAQKKQAEEEQQKIEQEKIKAQRKENRYVGFSCFNIGYALPSNSNSKATFDYSAFSSNMNSVPFTVALNEGRLGLTRGFSVGFTGISAFKGLNSKLSDQNKMFGLGLALDFNQTLMYYDYKNINDYPETQSWYFKDFKSQAFAITSVGMGFSVTKIINEKQTFVDLYGRADINIFWRGSYEASVSAFDTTLGTTIDAVAKGYRDENKKTTFAFSPSFGISFRKNRFFIGVEWRYNLIDKNASFTDDFRYTLGSFGTPNNRIYTFSPTKPLDLSYFSFKIGLVLKSAASAQTEGPHTETIRASNVRVEK